MERQFIILTEPKRRRRTMPLGQGGGGGHMGKHQGWSGGRGREGKTQARVLIVVSMGGVREAASSLRIGWINNFSGLWA